MSLLPVWFLNTKWNGKTYSFAMNGQTGKIIGDSGRKRSADPVLDEISYIFCCCHFCSVCDTYAGGGDRMKKLHKLPGFLPVLLCLAGIMWLPVCVQAKVYGCWDFK